MTTKSKAGIDRKSVYLPNLSRWDWDKLSDDEIAKRLKLARDSRDKMVRWRADIARERDEMWAKLRERLPEAKLEEARWGLEHIEDAGKQMKQLDRLVKQADEAIEHIEDHVNGGRLVTHA